MAVESYIEDILYSSEATFRKILSEVIARNDQKAEIELVRQYTQEDETLFAAIRSILDDLKVEEGVVSRFLYRYFNIDLFKNKKREQLILLGSQLKTQYTRLKAEKRRVNVHIDNILMSLENLRQLKDAFNHQMDALEHQRERNRSESFIRRLNKKIEELNRYKEALEEKQRTLASTEETYGHIYHQIPRYYDLKEDPYLNLIGYKQPKVYG